MWVGEIIVSGTRVNPTMSRGKEHWAIIVIEAQRWTVASAHSAHNANLTGTLVMVFAGLQWGVGVSVFFFSFLVRFLRLREKIFRRSRHLTDSIWRSICLGAKSVETGDRHCAYVTKPNIDSLLGEPRWHSWNMWSSWSSWPNWHRSEAKVKKETPGTMHYIYVALKQPKKIDALPCVYPPRPSR